MITEEQRLRRKNGIFSSDVSKIMTGKAVQVAAEKLGLVEPDDISGKTNVRLGNALESHVLDSFERMSGCGEMIRSPDTMYHKTHSWLGCHLDALILNPREVVEAKVFAAQALYKFGEEGGDEMPPARLWQGLTHMAVTDCLVVHIPVLSVTLDTLSKILCDGKIPDEAIYYYKIDNDEHAQYAINELMIPKCKQVWECIQSGGIDLLAAIDDDGEVLNTEAASLLYRNDQEGPMAADPKALSLIEALNYAKEDHKAAAKAVDGLSEMVKRIMKNHSEIVINGIDAPLVTWKQAKGKKLLNEEKLKEEFPEAYKACLENQDGSRRFLVK